jgi:GTP-binding protein
MPNLGVVSYGEETFVVADIPGLVEGAHRGVGLGHSFLRHVERTRGALHVIDVAAVDGRDPWQDYCKINEELRLYRPELAERPQLIVLNKCDLPDAEVFVEEYKARFVAEGREVFEISAATRSGVELLIRKTALMLDANPLDFDRTPRVETLELPVSTELDYRFTVEAVTHGWRVRGRRIERLVSMTNFAQPESLGRLQRVLEATGISTELLKQGIEIGQTVYIEKASLVWTEDYVP